MKKLFIISLLFFSNINSSQKLVLDLIPENSSTKSNIQIDESELVESKESREYDCTDSLGHRIDQYFMKKVKFEDLKKYIENNNINKQNANGSTPLILACSENSFDLAQFLIKQGANVNLPDKEGNSPLHNTILQTKNVKLVSILIKKGANVDSKNYLGLTPLMCAAYKNHNEIITMLLKSGANRSLKSKDHKTALEYANDKETKKLIINTCPVPSTAVVILKSAEYKLASEDNQNEELMIAAKRNNKNNINKILQNEPNIINNQSYNGMTALMYAACENNNDIINILVQNGADLEIKDSNSKTALDYATEQDTIELLEKLERQRKEEDEYLKNYNGGLCVIL